MKKTLLICMVCITLALLVNVTVAEGRTASGTADRVTDSGDGASGLGALSGSQIRDQKMDSHLMKLMVVVPSLTEENLDEVVTLIKQLDSVRNVKPDLESRTIEVSFLRERDFDVRMTEHLNDFDSEAKATVVIEREQQAAPPAPPRQEVQAVPAKQAIVSVPDLDRDKARELGMLVRQIEGIQRMIPDYETNTLRIIYNEDMDFEASVFTKLKGHNSDIELKDFGQEVNNNPGNNPEKTADNPVQERRRCPGCTGGDSCSHSS